MLSLFPELFTYQQIAPFVLRLVLAFIFIGSGYSKLFKTRLETVKFFESTSIRPAKFWTILVGSTELISGFLLFLGFLTQAASISIIIIMTGAILKVKIKQGFWGGYEFELLVLVCALSLLVLGPGILAIDLPL